MERDELVGFGEEGWEEGGEVVDGGTGREVNNRFFRRSGEEARFGGDELAEVVESVVRGRDDICIFETVGANKS